MERIDHFVTQKCKQLLDESAKEADITFVQITVNDGAGTIDMEISGDAIGSGGPYERTFNITEGDL
jgi:hypothetical protein